jgi:hypothetical protein
VGELGRAVPTLDGLVLQAVLYGKGDTRLRRGELGSLRTGRPLRVLRLLLDVQVEVRIVALTHLATGTGLRCTGQDGLVPRGRNRCGVDERARRLSQSADLSETTKHGGCGVRVTIGGWRVPLLEGELQS